MFQILTLARISHQPSRQLLLALLSPEASDRYAGSERRIATEYRPPERQPQHPRSRTATAKAGEKFWPGLMLVLMLSLNGSAIAAEVPLRAFTASYDLTISGMNLGTAKISLEPAKELWRWRLSTRARGIYSMFIHKKPFSETTFSHNRDQIRLQQIVISDEKNKDKYESASFDWQSGHMQVMRKGKASRVALTTSVYDYQSIHLLAAAMRLQQLENATVSFYRKGKLVESSLVYRGGGSVKIGGKDIDARIFEQTTAGSKIRVKYFYDEQNPLLPLLIERRDGDDSPSIMKLREVQWQS